MSTPEPSLTEAVLRGGAQGLTLGFSDELTSGTLAGVEFLSETVSNFSQGKIEFGEFLDTYKTALDQARAADAAAQEAHPIAFGAGEVGGTLVTGLATGGAGLARGALTLGGKLAAGAITGAALTGATAAGKSEADLTQGEFGEFAGDVALGTAIGAATGVGGELASKALGAVGQAIGRTGLGSRAKSIIGNVISPKGVASNLSKAARANTKRTFSQVENKNLEAGISGLQKKGLLPTARNEFLGADKRELFKTVTEERTILGKSIERVVNLVDESGVDFGSNTLGIDKLRTVVKALKKSSTSDEFSSVIGDVEDLLGNRVFKASDVLGLKRELDNLIKTGTNLKSLRKSQNSALKEVRTRLKELLEEKVDDAALKNPAIKEELGSHGVKNFAELNDEFANTSVVGDVLKDAAALSDEAVGAAEAAPALEGLADIRNIAGILSKISRPVEAVARGIGTTVRRAVQASKDSALVARTLYPSLDEDNVLQDENDRRIFQGDLSNNASLSHGDRARQMNRVTSTGKIDPDSIPQDKIAKILRQLEDEDARAEREIMAQVLIDLGVSQ